MGDYFEKSVVVGEQETDYDQAFTRGDGRLGESHYFFQAIQCGVQPHGHRPEGGCCSGDGLSHRDVHSLSPDIRRAFWDGPAGSTLDIS